MEDEIATPPPPPSKLKVAIPLLGVLILGLGGGFGINLVMSKKGTEAGGAAPPGQVAAEGPGAPAGGAQGEGAGEPMADGGAAVAPQGTTITTLGRFTINLRGSGGGRILQMEVAIEADAAAGSSLEALTPKLRDSINTAVSEYTWTELEGSDGKTRLKDELLSRINGVAAPVVVNAVYLTSFVVS